MEGHAYAFSKMAAAILVSFPKCCPSIECSKSRKNTLYSIALPSNTHMSCDGSEAVHCSLVSKVVIKFCLCSNVIILSWTWADNEETCLSCLSCCCTTTLCLSCNIMTVISFSSDIWSSFTICRHFCERSSPLECAAYVLYTIVVCGGVYSFDLGLSSIYSGWHQNLSYQKKSPRVPESGVVGEHTMWMHQRITTHGNELTTSVECICGKVCKNPHGLKIHQAKIKCMQTVQVWCTVEMYIVVNLSDC